MKLDINNYKFYMDKLVYTNLDIILNEAIPNKWDGLFIVTGKEGVGKTTFSSQIALYQDHRFTVDNVAWLPQQFERLVEELPPESSILWDEAITGANAANWANAISVSIISKLTQIRKKKLKIILCFPYLFMLNKYFVNRCVGSFHIFSRGFKKRGFGYAYNQRQTEYLYGLIKERYRLQPLKAYNMAKQAFQFRFSSRLCMDEEEYEKRKDVARQSDDSKADKWKDNFIKAIQYVKDCNNNDVPLSINAFAHFTGFTPQYIHILGKKQKF